MAYYERTGSTAPATPPPVPTSYRRPERDPQQIEMGRNANRRLPTFKVILGVLACFALLGAVIFSNVQQLQISNEITQLQKEYEDLDSEYKRMQSEIAGKTSRMNIEEYAENVLGMQKLDSSQIEYVQIQRDDVVEIPEEEQNIFVRIKTWFDDLVEYLRG